MRFHDLPVVGLQHIRSRAVQHTGPPQARIGKAGGVLAAVDAASTGFHSDQVDVFVIAVGVE